MAAEKQKKNRDVRPLSLDSVNFDDKSEMEDLLSQVLEAGNAIVAADQAEMIRKGIINERGDLLKTELPEDMREGTDRDFGG